MFSVLWNDIDIELSKISNELTILIVRSGLKRDLYEELEKERGVEMRNFGHNLILYFNQFLMRRRELADQIHKFQLTATRIDTFIVNRIFRDDQNKHSTSVELGLLKADVEHIKDAIASFDETATELLNKIEQT